MEDEGLRPWGAAQAHAGRGTGAEEGLAPGAFQAGRCEQLITRLAAQAPGPAPTGSHEVLHHPSHPRHGCPPLGRAPQEPVVSFVVTQQFYEGP